MTARLDLTAPEAKKPMELLLAIEGYIHQSGLDERLLLLVKIRASQINHCAYCLHMHTADALKAGEAPARLFLLEAWRESALYTPRERAALAWTESLTNVAATEAPDADFAEVSGQFSRQELVDLSLAITMINSWNRLCVGFRVEHPNDHLKQAA